MRACARARVRGGAVKTSSQTRRKSPRNSARPSVTTVKGLSLAAAASPSTIWDHGIMGSCRGGDTQTEPVGCKERCRTCCSRSRSAKQDVSSAFQWSATAASFSIAVAARAIGRRDADVSTYKYDVLVSSVLRSTRTGYWPVCAQCCQSENFVPKKIVTLV